MRRSQWIAAALACLAGAAQGEEVDFAAKSKAIASAAAVRAAAPSATAPFSVARDAAALREPVPFRLDQAMNETRLSQSACERSAHDLCYDATDGRIVYRGGRSYMPRIGDLTPESVSLRRHRIIFKYSF